MKRPSDAATTLPRSTSGPMIKRRRYLFARRVTVRDAACGRPATRTVGALVVTLAVGTICAAGALRAAAPQTTRTPDVHPHEPHKRQKPPARCSTGTASAATTSARRRITATWPLTPATSRESANIRKSGKRSSGSFAPASCRRRGVSGPIPPAAGVRDLARKRLDRAAAATESRTHGSVHRLNRAEYRNVIRDLLGLDIDVAALLPTDDASYGFDNIAGALKINQSQMEQYLAAARKISRTAIGGPLPAPTAQEFRVPETLPQDEHVEGLPLGTRGGLRPIHLSGYRRGRDRCRSAVPRAGRLLRERGVCRDDHLEVAIDGKQVKLFTLEPRKEFRPEPERKWRVRVPVEAGPHDVTVAFSNCRRSGRPTRGWSGSSVPST